MAEPVLLADVVAKALAEALERAERVERDRAERVRASELPTVAEPPAPGGA